MSAKTTGGSAITIVAAVIGGVALLGSGAGAAFAGVNSLAGPDTTSIAPVASLAGVTGLDVHVSAVDMTVTFYDGEDVRLDTDGDVPLRLAVRVGEIRVGSTDRFFTWFTPGWTERDQRATLLLPESLAGIDADLTLDAGSLTASGDFGELDAVLNAGILEISGSARELDAEVNAGSANIVLDDVEDASYSLSAGRMEAELTKAPSEVSVDVSAGSLLLTVPDAEYDVQRGTSFGALDSSLRESAGSDHRIDVSVAAGRVVLSPADGR